MFKKLKKISITFFLVVAVFVGFLACQKDISRSKLNDEFPDNWILVGTFSTEPKDEYIEKLMEIGIMLKEKYPDARCRLMNDQATDRKGNPMPNMVRIYYRPDMPL